MTEPTKPGFFRRLTRHTARTIYTAAIAASVASVASILATVALIQGAKEAHVELPPELPHPTVVLVNTPNPATGGEHGPMGWVPPTPEEVQENLDPVRTLQFDATPAGKAAMGDETVLGWQAVRKVNPGKPPGWYPNIDQKNVGCCVGAGFKHTADVCQAMQILNGRRAEWKPLSAEYIYGVSRVDIGGGQLRGDGSVGAWAAKAVRDHGVAPMEKIGDTDLTEFSPNRARQWGSSGVPRAVKELAKQFPVKGIALVKSWEDVYRAGQQGYLTALCSNVGFDNPDGSVGTRDAEGFCKPRGNWNHCMAIIAVRGGARPGAFILNSWGNSAHRGPVSPADAPVAGFWCDAAVIDRMVRQNDSWALSDMTGFPARKVPLDTFIRRPTIRPDPFTLRGELWTAA